MLDARIILLFGVWRFIWREFAGGEWKELQNGQQIAFDWRHMFGVTNVTWYRDREYYIYKSDLWELMPNGEKFQYIAGQFSKVTTIPDCATRLEFPK